jgi:hypothetical protein
MVPVHAEGYAIFVTRAKEKGLLKISRRSLENSNKIDPKGVYGKDEAIIRTAWAVLISVKGVELLDCLK